MFTYSTYRCSCCLIHCLKYGISVMMPVAFHAIMFRTAIVWYKGDNSNRYAVSRIVTHYCRLSTNGRPCRALHYLHDTPSGQKFSDSTYCACSAHMTTKALSESVRLVLNIVTWVHFTSLTSRYCFYIIFS